MAHVKVCGLSVEQAHCSHGYFNYQCMVWMTCKARSYWPCFQFFLFILFAFFKVVIILYYIILMTLMLKKKLVLIYAFLRSFSQIICEVRILQSGLAKPT